MNKYNGRHHHWDEFQWEEEIRRDERRISGYFRELALCLDLPDEEELIYGQLSNRPDLVPSAEAAEALRSFFSDSEEEEDCSEHPVSNRRTPESATIDELDMLCAEWNIFTARPMSPEQSGLALGCSCAFAKLLARTADFLEPGSASGNQLRITLGKRALNDLNDTAGHLAAFAQLVPGSAGTIERNIVRLGEIRERLISFLSKLR